MVMPSNNTSALVRQLGRLFPGNMGLLVGPGGWREPASYLPYALDNGAYGAHINGTEWKADEWLTLLEIACASRIKPIWAAIPDKVADAMTTRTMWREWSPFVREHGIPCAFVVQDGMEPHHVPEDADLVFVGGSTTWKWANLAMWTSSFPRVHVGRVNTLKWLLKCEEVGAESCDGTGWFRGDIPQTRELVQYITRNVPRQLTLFHEVPEAGE